MYDNQTERSEDSCYQDKYQIITKEIEANTLNISGNESEGDPEYNELIYNEIPLEYLDDDDKDV